jgi:hypothetical protein
MNVFEQFFEHSIQICSQAGLLGEGPVYMDATHVGAAASLESLVRKEETVRPPLSAKDYIQRVYTENPASQEEDGAISPLAADNKTVPESEHMTDRDHEARKQPQSKNQEYVRRTDPDATIVHSVKGGLKLAYKAHVAISGKRGLVVTAAIATTGITGEEHR